MPLQIWFWIIYVLAVLFYHFIAYDPARPWFRWAGGGWVLFLLIGILGYATFGSAIK